MTRPYCAEHHLVAWRPSPEKRDLSRLAKVYFRRASWDEDVAAARIHFELMVKIGAAMRDTLQEIERSQQQPSREAA